jgi:hypothetical protein
MIACGVVAGQAVGLAFLALIFVRPLRNGYACKEEVARAMRVGGVEAAGGGGGAPRTHGTSVRRCYPVRHPLYSYLFHVPVGPLSLT